MKLVQRKKNMQSNLKPGTNNVLGTGDDEESRRKKEEARKKQEEANRKKKAEEDRKAQAGKKE